MKTMDIHQIKVNTKTPTAVGKEYFTFQSFKTYFGQVASSSMHSLSSLQLIIIV